MTPTADHMKEAEKVLDKIENTRIGPHLTSGLSVIIAAALQLAERRALEGPEVLAVVENAQTVMDALEDHASDAVPHLLDTDDNAGQRLREALASFNSLRGKP